MIIKQYSDEYISDLTNLMSQWDDAAPIPQRELEKSIEIIKENSQNEIFIAVNENNRAVGYIFTGVCFYLGFKPFVEVIQLLVDKGYRSRGIGEMLIGHVEKYYKNAGIDEIKLNSRMERKRAHSFYLRYGFREFKQSKFFEKTI